MSTFLQQGLTMDAKIRYLWVEANDIANIAHAKHNLAKGALFHSTEAIVASLLLSSQIKGDERLSFQLKSETPKFNFICDINAEGKVRAKISPSNFSLEENADIDGYLFISKHNAKRELYRGITEIKEERIQEGLHRYFKNSGQIDSLMRISVQVSDVGDILRASGFLLERLPESPLSPSATSEEFYKAYQELSETSDFTFRQSLDKKKVCGYDIFPLETTPLEWECNCSQEKIESMLTSLGSKEIKDIIKEQGDASVTCEFCSTEYHCNKEQLLFLLSHFEEK
jgi:molecular chaperone Hsp33